MWALVRGVEGDRWSVQIEMCGDMMGWDVPLREMEKVASLMSSQRVQSVGMAWSER
jgi:hypothetical protein